MNEDELAAFLATDVVELVPDPSIVCPCDCHDPSVFCCFGAHANGDCCTQALVKRA